MQRPTTQPTFIASYSALFSEITDKKSKGIQPHQSHKKSYYTYEEVQELLQEKQQLWEEEYPKRVEKDIEQARVLALEQGRIEAQRSFEDHIGKMMKSLSDEKKILEDRFQHYLQELKPLLIDLVFELAEKIIGAAPANSALAEQLELHVQRMIDNLKEDETAMLEVSEHDYPYISNAFDTLSNKIDITLVSDSSLQSGEFRFKTEELQIMKIYRKMLHDFRESVTDNGAHNDPNK